jgi:NAD(P)-dependent dehydrogenase (short-subunit alcohol dehydrogenase family)
MKTALITGTSSGIGEAAANYFPPAGMESLRNRPRSGNPGSLEPEKRGHSIGSGRHTAGFR